MAKGDDILERLTQLAVDTITVCDRLPATAAGKHIADQLLRSGTAAASNYAEARGGESKRDFVHKLGLVLKELKETSVWLDILNRKLVVLPSELAGIRDEVEQLCRIIGASLRTAKSR